MNTHVNNSRRGRQHGQTQSDAPLPTRPESAAADEHAFDTLTKELASAGSRRRLLRVLGGGTLGAVATGLLGSSKAVAKEKCRQLVHECKVDADCCSKTCATFSGVGGSVQMCATPDPGGGLFPDGFRR